MKPTLTVKNVVPAQAFSPENCPDLADSEAVAQAGKPTGERYCWNNLPDVMVTWKTCLNHLGHQESPSRFRCHDDKHKTDDGEMIGKKFSTCHNVVAEEESDSALLQELGIQEPPPAPAEPAESAEPMATSASR